MLARLRPVVLLGLATLLVVAPPARAGRRADAPPPAAQDDGYDGAAADDGATEADDDAGDDVADDQDVVDPDLADVGDDDPLPGTRPHRTPTLPPVVPVPTGRTVPGRIAYVRADGKAAIPRSAPARVKALIASANQIIGKPYKWGGGHARLRDRGYDCSGSVGFGLIGAGLLTGPMTSGQLAHWGSAGAGRWLTVFANRDHVYLEVAGLRLDTSAVGDGDRRSGVRWRAVIGRRTGFHARHAVGF